MSWTSETWPIGAALLQYPGTLPDGTSTTMADDAAWAGVLREVRLAGFDHVDLTDTWLPVGDLAAPRLDALRRLLLQEGLGVSAISVSRRSIIDHDAAAAEANVAYSYRTIDAAVALGVDTVCLGLHQALTADQQAAMWFWHEPGAADPEDPEVYRHAVSTFRELGAYAAERGVALSLEMYEDTYLGTADSCVRMVTDIGLENVGLNPDVGNLVRLHRPVEDWRTQFEKMLPYTNYMHVKNYYRDLDVATGAYFSAPAPLELGFINYRAVVDMALDAGFAGTFCVEHYGGDGLSVAARNRDYLRTILAAKLTLRSGTVTPDVEPATVA
ncbi:sugar phosphate isomerase/epimerase [Georgenia sp. EYE_87]|uniref:sugar phosphate isomerase/epimerase family protein n=1 Tax=Georgenia sp. EYE_87 TaxID=2853448 RepID=UPI0020062E13|nr:sugar phosphate isomerase/epimerase family protein [Georgenia sp. EYE_87]